MLRVRFPSQNSENVLTLPLTCSGCPARATNQPHVISKVHTESTLVLSLANDSCWENLILRIRFPSQNGRNALTLSVTYSSYPTLVPN